MHVTEGSPDTVPHILPSTSTHSVITTILEPTTPLLAFPGSHRNMDLKRSAEELTWQET
jgi:hypothetical protein